MSVFCLTTLLRWQAAHTVSLLAGQFVVDDTPKGRLYGTVERVRRGRERGRVGKRSHLTFSFKGGPGANDFGECDGEERGHFSTYLLFC